MLPNAFWRGFGSPTMLEALEQALPSPQPDRIAVALSGGADSAMLAAHAALAARKRGFVVHCLHVHHGLQDRADGWRDHAHDLALRLGLPCHTRRVCVTQARDLGMEAAARDARYQALAALAREIKVAHILLAHHRNDQSETVLLRLLRGAGPEGLAAMAPRMQRDGIAYLRPWLDIDRTMILEQAAAFTTISGWSPVHDPTNADDKYTRAAVRERLAPVLDERWPGWRGVLTRLARQSADTRAVLGEVAAADFAGLAPSPDGRSFSLAAWRQLSMARQALVLRYWLAQSGLRMPSDARLQDLMRQLRQLHALGHDRQMRVKHGADFILCARGRVYLAEERGSEYGALNAEG